MLEHVRASVVDGRLLSRRRGGRSGRVQSNHQHRFTVAAAVRRRRRRRVVVVVTGSRGAAPAAAAAAGGRRSKHASERAAELRAHRAVDEESKQPIVPQPVVSCERGFNV